MEMAVISSYHPVPEHKQCSQVHEIVSISVLPLHCAVLTVPSGSNSVKFNYISNMTSSLRMTNISSFQKHISHTMSQGCSINSL